MARPYNRTRISLLLLILLSSGYSLAQGISGPYGTNYVPNPYAGMFGSMGNVYSPYYRRFHQQGMIGMTGMGIAEEPVVPYQTNPYAGMFGSMGNVYSPYYRQFHQQGMSGMTGMGIAEEPVVPYQINPYAGMFGSMGNIYSQHYRRWHRPNASGAPLGAPAVPKYGGAPYRYPYFLAPTSGILDR